MRRFLRGDIGSGRLTGAQRVAEERYLRTIDKNIARLTKNSDEQKAISRKALRALESQFLAEFQSIVGSYASNFGRNPVTAPGTVQHFENHSTIRTRRPSTRFRETIYAKHAMQAAFE